MKTQATLFKTSLLLLVIITALLSGLMACKPQEQDLSFKTISEGTGSPTGLAYDGQDPNFVIIAKPEEVDAPGLDIQFTSELRDVLRALDYQHNFAVILLRGLKLSSSSKAAIDIVRIVRKDATVTFQVHLSTPVSDDSLHPPFSSPYHAIVVVKENEWKQQIYFVLLADDKPVAETSRFIP